ncbi:MAG: ABC transporter permease subunit [Oscillospiraceae bacterium]|nr:ABC transporter permease subunit [Oscillospiraceae bacterium]
MKQRGRALLIAAVWLGLWAALAALVGRELLLPGPVPVFARLWELMGSRELWRTAALSLGRIALGAAGGIVLGALLSGLAARFSWLGALLSPLLTVIRSTPVASFILLLLIWLGRDILPSVIVLLMVLPVIWGGVQGGLANLDEQLLEMARLYRLGSGRTLWRVVIPSVLPSFLAACRTAVGLAWKAGIAAEVLTVPRLSIGRHLYESKLYLETVDLFAWTLLVIVLSLLLEGLLNRVFRRWERRTP